MFYTHASPISILLTALALPDWTTAAFVGGLALRVTGGLRIPFLAWGSMLGGINAMSIIALASLAYDFSPWLVQLYEVIVDAGNLRGESLNPSRVKTVCLPGTRLCIDF
jgi:hypothetical protein